MAELEQKQQQLDVDLADHLLRRKDPMDPFSVYWRVTMRDLIVRKYGREALSRDEHVRGWTLIDHIDPEVLLRRLAAITGLRFAEAAYSRAAIAREHPASALAVVKWVESDIEHLGPRIKDMGATLSSRGWQQIYQARGMAPSPARMQLLTLAADTFADLFLSAPSDWVPPRTPPPSPAALRGHTHTHTHTHHTHTHTPHTHTHTHTHVSAVLTAGEAGGGIRLRLRAVRARVVFPGYAPLRCIPRPLFAAQSRGGRKTKTH